MLCGAAVPVFCAGVEVVAGALVVGACDWAGADVWFAGGVAGLGGYLVAEGADGNGWVGSWADPAKAKQMLRNRTGMARIWLFIIAVTDGAASPGKRLALEVGAR